MELDAALERFRAADKVKKEEAARQQKILEETKHEYFHTRALEVRLCHKGLAPTTVLTGPRQIHATRTARIRDKDTGKMVRFLGDKPRGSDAASLPAIVDATSDVLQLDGPTLKKRQLAAIADAV